LKIKKDERRKVVGTLDAKRITPSEADAAKRRQRMCAGP